MIIAMSGIDCAGKGTQIELLQEHFHERSITCTHMWHRPGYSPGLNQFKDYLRKLKPGSILQGPESKARKQAFEKKGVQYAWSTMALLDTILAFGFQVRRLAHRFDVVICDRYLIDSFLDLELRFPNLGVENWPLAAVTRAVSPKPDAAFLLTITWEEMIRRMEIKNEPFPDPPDIRRVRYDRYQELSRTDGASVIEGDASPTEVHQNILTILRDCDAYR